MVWLWLMACASEELGFPEVDAEVEAPAEGGWDAPADPSGGQLPPPAQPTFELAVEPLVVGTDIDLVASGVTPGEVVDFGVGIVGMSCPPALGGQCLSMARPTWLGDAVADAAGTASLTVPLDAAYPVDRWLVFQAATIDGAASEVSRVVLRRTDLTATPLPTYADVFEPNQGRAARIVPGTLHDLTSYGPCGSDGDPIDRFRFEADAGAVVDLTLTFERGTGDYYELRLVSPDGAWQPFDKLAGPVEWSASAPVAGTWELLVACGYMEPEDVYDLDLAVSGP